MSDKLQYTARIHAGIRVQGACVYRRRSGAVRYKYMGTRKGQCPEECERREEARARCERPTLVRLRSCVLRLVTMGLSIWGRAHGLPLTWTLLPAVAREGGLPAIAGGKRRCERSCGGVSGKAARRSGLLTSVEPALAIGKLYRTIHASCSSE